MASSPLTSPSLTKAYDYCRLVTRTRARNFYVGFLSLPPRHRPAVHAIYAFCRTCDDFADSAIPASEKVAHLEGYRRHLKECFEDRPKGPVFVALHDVAQRYALASDLLDEVITGVQMDLTVRRYATFDDLLKYCYRVASVVGLLSLKIFGCQGAEARQHAIDMGIAMQLVNILRDIKEDAERDRIYLPLEDMARFGYPESGLASGLMNQEFRSLMAFEAGRAREHFRSSAPLIPMIPRESRACPAILGALYSRLLDRIEARNWNVFDSRASLSATEKLWLAARTWTTLTLKGTHAGAPPSS